MKIIIGKYRLQEELYKLFPIFHHNDLQNGENYLSFQCNFHQFYSYLLLSIKYHQNKNIQL